MNRSPSSQQCCRCGCTEDDCGGCIARTGSPCHWVTPGLCSACDFDIVPGGRYRCEDGRTRTVLRIEAQQVTTKRRGLKPYTMTLGRFKLIAMQRLDRPTSRGGAAVGLVTAVFHRPRRAGRQRVLFAPGGVT